MPAEQRPTDDLTPSRPQRRSPAPIAPLRRAFAICCALASILALSLTSTALAASWSAASPPSPTGSQTFLEGVSCTSSKFCEAVGYFENTSFAQLPMIEEWTGSWSLQATVPLPTGAKEARLQGVSCASTKFCEAVGYYVNAKGLFALAEKWNGSKWEAETPPIPAAAEGATLSGVSCTSEEFCEAVGSYSETPKQSFDMAEQWNGAKWAVQTAPSPAGSDVNNLTAASCTTTKYCEGVGYYREKSSGKEFTTAEEWTGTAWKLQTSVNQTGVANRLWGVSCISPEFCEAVGDYVNTAGTEELTLAERWNSVSWALQTTPNRGTQDYLKGVSCPSAKFCEAVGRSQSGPESLAEEWEGTKWETQVTPKPVGASLTELHGVSCLATPFCQAGGRYFNSTPAEVPLAEIYK